MTTMPFSDPGYRASRAVVELQTQPAAKRGAETTPLPERPDPGGPNRRLKRKRKAFLAFGLGVLLVVQTSSSFWLACSTLSSELRDVVKWVCVSVSGMWVSFLIVQFLLSRGNPRAVRQDWPVIAALNFAPFGSVIVIWALVTGEAALAMLVVANITLGCSYAGAALAALIARRRLRGIAAACG